MKVVRYISSIDKFPWIRQNKRKSSDKFLVSRLFTSLKNMLLKLNKFIYLLSVRINLFFLFKVKKLEREKKLNFCQAEHTTINKTKIENGETEVFLIVESARYRVVYCISNSEINFVHKITRFNQSFMR